VELLSPSSPAPLIAGVKSIDKRLAISDTVQWDKVCGAISSA
jgi:hypothetical protein